MGPQALKDYGSGKTGGKFGAVFSALTESLNRS